MNADLKAQNELMCAWSYRSLARSYSTGGSTPATRGSTFGSLVDLAPFFFGWRLFEYLQLSRRLKTASPSPLTFRAISHAACSSRSSSYVLVPSFNVLYICV